MKFRALNKWYANTHGYFWLPCPLCKQPFGGHEWKDRKGLSSTVWVTRSSGHGICPDCTLAGKGDPR